MPTSDQTSDAPADELQLTAVHPAGSVLISLAFWCSLAAAASVYAAVALSPKFVVWIDVRQQHRDNALRLHELEQQVDYLERVVQTLKTDPEFARRVAESGNTAPTVAAEANVPTPRDGSTEFESVLDSSAAKTQLLSPDSLVVIRRIASEHKLRSALLTGSAAVTLFAFTLLNEAGGSLVISAFSAIIGTLKSLFRRYVRPLETIDSSPEPDQIPR
ncbi:MAG: hypothetical protein WCK86_08440 [Planctomycetia bacterium]